jgi:hypothetical protein
MKGNVHCVFRFRFCKFVFHSCPSVSCISNKNNYGSREQFLEYFLAIFARFLYELTNAGQQCVMFIPRDLPLERFGVFFTQQCAARPISSALLCNLSHGQAVARRAGKTIGADKTLGYKHAMREREVLAELDKVRKDMKEGKEIKQEKQELKQSEQDWQNIKEGLQEQWMERVVKPLEKMTGAVSSQSNLDLIHVLIQIHAIVTISQTRTEMYWTTQTIRQLFCTCIDATFPCGLAIHLHRL